MRYGKVKYESGGGRVMERVAICGVMASGKTHIAEVLVKEQGFTKFSLATGVKDLARDVFLLEGKVR